MNDRLQAELQTRIQAFASDIVDVLQRAVADSVQSALGGNAKRAAPQGRRGPGRPKGATNKKSKFDADTLLREVAKNGDRRMEEIAKSLGLRSTKVLAAPMKALIAAKKVKASGKARGTRYRST